MAQPQLARITCTECNGWYNSERELRAHMLTAHRRFLPEPTTLPDSPKMQPGISKDEWAILTVQLRNRVQAHFKAEELDAIDRFILLAREGSVFLQVPR
jgi:hypothetical protein